MKRWSILVLGITSLFPIVVPAQTAAPAASSSSPVSVLDRLKDPEQRRQLQQALDILERAASDKAAEAKPGDHKTVGDALDKGLDMAKDTVVYLANKIEQVAPQLWHVLVLQQYVKGLMGLVQPIGLLLVIFIYRKLLLRWWKASPEDEGSGPLFNEAPGKDDFPEPTHKGWRGIFTVFLPLVAIVLSSVWLCFCFADSIGYFVNPNYYALKDIIQLVKNPSGF